MVRKLSALMYDNDADSITRPDIPAALVPSEEDARASGFHARVERELAPYTAAPVLTARLNDATVPDAALRVSMAQSARTQEHTPSAPSVLSAPPRSGTRQQLASTVPPPAMASTIPPPRRARTKDPAASDSAPTSNKRGERIATPLPAPASKRGERIATPLPALASDKRGERIATPLPALASNKRGERIATPLPAPASAPVPTPASAPAPVSQLHAYVLVLGTAVAAAAIGIGLGNGSLGRFGTRVRAAFVGLDDAPAPLVTGKVGAAHAASTPSATSASPAQPLRASAPVEPPKVPVMRIDQLPATEQASVAENEPKTSETNHHELKRSRRVPHH